MIINLFAVRIVLKALGADDYGLYQVVAGVVITFQSFSSVIHTSTLRFYSYSIGEKSITKLSEIFSASINIYFVVGICCLILGETLGLWFVNTQLVIPADRILASNWVYQFAVLSLIISLFQAPFSSVVIAYEEMGYFAIVSLSESILKLIAIVLISYSSGDRLILYGLSLLIVPIGSLIAYYWKVKASFSHVKYTKVRNRYKYRELLSFSGWHLFSAGASVGINQVNTILINIFFPLVVNAARGIAMQVLGAFNAFSSSIITAVRPPLIKAYAEQNYDYLNLLFNYSNKFIYYMILVIALPMMFEMNTVLEVWLGESTPDMILFSRLIIVYSIILCLNNPISIIIQATGKIKEYYIPVEIVTLTCPIFTYIFFRMGCPAQASFYSMIGTISVAHCVRVYCLKRYYPWFEIRKYLFEFILPAIFITILLTFIFFITQSFLTIHPIIFILLSIIVTTTTVFLLGFNATEKTQILHLLKTFLKH